MKKIFLSFLTALCALSFAVGFSACELPFGANKHTHTPKQNEWTTDAQGHSTVCDCGEIIQTDAHTFGEWKTERTPTCLIKGKESATCTICGYKEIRTIDTLEHVVDTYTTTETTHAKSCRLCNTAVEDAVEHTFGEWNVVSDSTCQTTGLKTALCEECGYEKSQRIATIGHTMSEEYFNNDRQHWHICTMCKKPNPYSYESHSYTDGFCVCGAEQPIIADLLDSVIEVEEGRAIRVLQLSDTQIIDASQTRPGRDGVNDVLYAPDQMEERVFKYIRDAVERTNPDLIILTGDIVYGEFDDAGTSLLALIEHMESYKIPWAPVYGNHDNESKKGAKWQNEMLSAAEYCLFEKGTTDGNGNYSVGIQQGDDIVRIFYMMDSNTCGNAYQPMDNGVLTSHGFTKNQLTWLYSLMDTATAANNGTPIPSSMAWHIPVYDHVNANQKYYSQATSFTINKEVKGDEGDFGSLRENGGIKGPFTPPLVDGKNFLSYLKKYGVDSTFVGHSHQVNTSIMHEGIRWTFGLKTGEYDRYNPSEMGGTSITIEDGNVTVKHVYYDRAYQTYMDTLEYKEPLQINGLGFKNGDLTHENGLTIYEETFEGENAHKIVVTTQGKVFINANLLRGKSTLTFSIYVPENSPCLAGMGPFALRIKPDSSDLPNSVPGISKPGGKYYIQYKTTDSAISVKLTEGTWQTFSVDISAISEICTELSFLIPTGSTVYLKDISLS